MRHTVSVGNRNLVGSGSLVLEKGDTEWSFEIDELKLVFRFIDDALADTTIRTSESSKKVGVVELVNFSGPLPISYVMPEAFSLDGMVYTLGIAVQTISSGANISRVVTYSLLGDE